MLLSLITDLGKVEGLGRKDVYQDHAVHVGVDLGNLNVQTYSALKDRIWEDGERIPVRVLVGLRMAATVSTIQANGTKLLINLIFIIHNPSAPTLSFNSLMVATAWVRSGTPSSRSSSSEAPSIPSTMSAGAKMDSRLQLKERKIF